MLLDSFWGFLKIFIEEIYYNAKLGWSPSFLKSAMLDFLTDLKAAEVNVNQVADYCCLYFDLCVVRLLFLFNSNYNLPSEVV